MPGVQKDGRGLRAPKLPGQLQRAGEGRVVRLRRAQEEPQAVGVVFPQREGQGIRGVRREIGKIARPRRLAQALRIAQTQPGLVRREL